MKEYTVLLSDGQRKTVKLDSDHVFRECYTRRESVHEMMHRIGARKGWLTTVDGGSRYIKCVQIEGWPR